MSAWRALLAVFCLLAPMLQAQQKYALLIGIDTYQPPNTVIKPPPGVSAGRFAPGAPLFTNLAGPTNDVASVRQVLTSAKFGFPNDDQHMHLLENSAATRAGILAAMTKYLINQPQKGDMVVLYVAAHGSLRVNTKSKKQTFDLGVSRHRWITPSCPRMLIWVQRMFATAKWRAFSTRLWTKEFA